MRKPPVHKSFFNAFRGIFLMVKTERNFQIELVAFFINIFLIFYLQLSATDAILILLVCFVVLSAEIFNTAVEKLCDMVQPDFDKRIGFIKDIAAGAVLLTSILAVVAGVIIYRKYLFQ
ncbi:MULTISPECIES: diacylglycerol kinase family protein [Chryseobacterium]|uniref:diacylglycerol kinase family protein n=1 Tax=Chryseobacterium TaxID=59732 RepID=UPI001294A6FB|nr:MULTISPECIES: diacylglycerol kinase family protein [Chryseobacterium]